MPFDRPFQPADLFGGFFVFLANAPVPNPRRRACAEPSSRPGADAKKLVASRGILQLSSQRRGKVRLSDANSRDLARNATSTLPGVRNARFESAGGINSAGLNRFVRDRVRCH
jgi:hypothetical protein